MTHPKNTRVVDRSLPCVSKLALQKTQNFGASQGCSKDGRGNGQSVTASDFGSNGPRFESGRGRCVESLDKALYSHCPKEKPSH